MKRILIASILILLVCCNHTKRCNSLLEEEAKRTYGHVVYDKYIDRSNHGISGLELQKDNRVTYFSFNLYPFVKVWHTVDIGDSLVKELGSTTFKVIKPHGIIKYVELHCPENDDIYWEEATFYFDSMKRVGHPIKYKE